MRLEDWSTSEGLLLPDGIRPTRPNVLLDIYQRSFTDWSWQARPLLDAQSVSANRTLIQDFGLLTSSVKRYGGVHINVLEGVEISYFLDALLLPWRDRSAGGWDRPLLIRALERMQRMGVIETINVAYFQLSENGVLRPRERIFHMELDSFGRIDQGRNAGTNYPGDRNLFAPDEAVFQIHRVVPTGGLEETFALGLYIPSHDAGLDRQILRGLASEQ